jgi:hypothetical protein
VSTLNARANQAWAWAAEDPAECNYAFDHQRAAFEEGWEIGYKTKQSELSREALEDAVQEALESLGIIGYPTSARNDAEEPIGIETVTGQVAGYVAALVREEQGTFCSECGGDLVHGNHDLTCSRLPLGDS